MSKPDRKLAFLLAAATATAFANITFEPQCPAGQQASGPCSALFSTVGNAQTLTIPTSIGNVTIQGGALFDAIANLPADETAVYGTAGNATGIGVTTGTGFTDPITITFPVALASFSLDVLNGNTQSVQYELADNVGNILNLTLAPNFSSGLQVMGFATTGSVFTLSVITGQSTSTGMTWDYLIDNINYTTRATSTPEPASALLIGLGLLAVGLARRRAKFILCLLAAIPFIHSASAATTAIALACPAQNGIAGTAYSSSSTASGGVPPYTISIVSGALPGGLTLNASSGAIAGTPLQAGTFAFTGKVVDSLIVGASGSPDSTAALCSIVVAPPPAAAEGPVFTGNAPTVSGSSATLIFTMTFATDRQFQWTSADSLFGALSTGGFITADTWTYTPANGTNPDTLSFTGHIGTIVIQGSVIFGDTLTAVVNVIQAGARNLRYLLMENRTIQITATVPPTPCQTVRAAGQNRPGPVMFQSTQTTQNFNTPTTLVMLQGSTATIPLTATKTMPQGNILYFVQRAADDNPAIGGANNLPTLTPTGGGAANLGTNQAGSFSIGAYVDVNGNGRRDFFEPPIYLNYVLAGLLGDPAINNNKPVMDSVQTNQTIIIARNPNTATTWSKMKVGSGNFNIATPNQNAIYLNATIDLVGGGADGLRGLDRVFGGWINNELPEQVQGFYTNNHVTNTVFASNRPASGIFLPGGVAPTLVDPPLLDAGTKNGTRVPGTGGDTSTLSKSRIRSRTNLARGSRIAIDAVDSPGDAFPRNDPGFPASTLRAADFGLTFNAYLALWTNAGADIGPTGAAADRLYNVGLIAPWNMRASWAISGAGVATAAGAPTVTSVGRSAQENVLLPATSTRMEVCSPTGLSLLATDARN